MRPLVPVIAGAAALLLAGTAFAADRIFWQSPHSVRTAMPTGAVVHVAPRCTLAPMGNSLKGADGAPPELLGGPGGPIPAGFTPVRAVLCGAYGDNKSATATQLETRDPGTLDRLLKAYGTTSIAKPPGDGCTTEMDFDPAVALVDAQDQAIMPGPPRDTCLHIIRAVRDVLEHGQWVVTDSATTHF